MPVVWRGRSQLTGQPIMLIVSRRKSRNRKTADMAQTFIVRDTPSSPWQHVKAARARLRRRPDHGKQDEMSAVCGSCPIKEACYVTWEKSVTSTHKAHRGQRVATPDELRRAIRGRAIRMGAAGDPAAVPFEVWEDLLRYGNGFTGYSHVWKTKPEFRSHLMASVESRQGKADANALGFRTFRIVPDGEGKQKDEIWCPATPEGGLRTTCAECQLCNGKKNSEDHRRSVAVRAHGALRKHLAFRVNGEYATAVTD